MNNRLLPPSLRDGEPSNAAFAVAPAPDSSSESSDSYTGDDARHFLQDWRATKDRYSEAIRENGQLEIHFEASQAALLAAEEETNAIRARLAESDAMVAGKLSSKKTLSYIFTAPFLTIFLPL